MDTIDTVIARYHLRADKKLGQHFLTDVQILNHIVEAARLARRCHIIEIGPGPGGLTRAILQHEHTASLTALELDPRCIQALKPLQHADPRLTVRHVDAMTVRIDDIAETPRAIIANLPYNIGTTLVMQWLTDIAQYGAAWIDSMTVMLQQEVVARLSAPPGTSHYGRISVLCQWLCEVEHCMDVPPACFAPPPRVMSSVIRIAPRQQLLYNAPYAQVDRFLRAAFAQRRKMLRNTLASWCSDPVTLLERCDIVPTRRAETLSLEEIDRLVRTRHEK